MKNVKKWMRAAIPCLTLSLLTALTACGTATPTGGGTSPGAEGPADVPAGAETLVGRVIQEDDGQLLLAKADGGAGDVYTVTVRERDVVAEDGRRTEVEEGDLVEVAFTGGIQETYPAQVGTAHRVTVRAEGSDDRCDLYLDVLDDLLEEDSALASGITQLGVDLTKTSLTPAERSAVAVALGWEENLPVVEGTWQELVDQGYIDGENLVWKDGVHLTVEETQTTDTGVTFHAKIWRSGLGAYFFNDCTARRAADGHWGDYRIGSVAVS